VHGLGWVAFIAWGAGCGWFEGSAECRLGVEHVVATTVAKEMHAIELVATPDGNAVALWSEPAGLFARPLDREGRPRADPTRLGLACDGGLAAEVADDGGLTLACLARPSRDDKEPRAGAAAIHVLGPDLVLRSSRSVGPAGPISHGIGIARAGAGTEVLWHDGSAEAQLIRWVALDRGGAVGGGVQPVRVVSDESHVASAPAIQRVDSGALSLWTEHRLRGERIESHLLAWTGGAAKPRVLARLRHLAPTPTFARGAEGLVVGFRDQPSTTRRAGLYLAPLSKAGTTLGERVRLGRADGVSRPALAGCMGGTVAAVPRTYGGNHFIGLHWIEANLARHRGGQQFYEDTHAFTQAATACLGDHALLLVGEHGMLDAPRATLRAVAYTCE
jgi:hypothetical protein